MVPLANFGEMVSSVHGGKIVWCLLSTVAKLSGVFCSPWQKGVVSFVHPGKKCLVSFGSGVFCPVPYGKLAENPEVLNRDSEVITPVALMKSSA